MVKSAYLLRSNWVRSNWVVKVKLERESKKMQTAYQGFRRHFHLILTHHLRLIIKIMLQI
jgi:hypothetical protein